MSAGMMIFRSLDDIPEDFGPSAVTVGKFDGVHLGHRAVIGRLLSVAHAERLSSVIALPGLSAAWHKELSERLSKLKKS